MRTIVSFLFFFVYMMSLAQAQTMAETAMVGQVNGTLAGAQTDAVNKMNAINDILAEPEKVVTPQPPAVTQAVDEAPDLKTHSLFFTPNQLAAIMRANRGFIAPKEAYDPNNQTNRPVDPGPRIIALSGIVYNGPNDWTIWLNNERVTPKQFPERVIGLTVEKDRIHVRWMDIANQRVVNITLHSNQQYLLDSDQIIPGT